MSNEQIQEILERDIAASTDKKKFSTPAEIRDYVNLVLNAAYSTQAISKSIQDIGWSLCGKDRIKRNKVTCRFYHKNLDGNIPAWAILNPTDEVSSMGHNSRQDTAEVESLKDVNFEFQQARRDKERALANTRKIETHTAAHREAHTKIQLARDRRDFISIADVVRDWNEALITLRQEIYAIPLKYSARWAGILDERIIESELKTEFDRLCTKLADAGNDVSGKGENELYKTQEEITKIDGRTP